MWWWNDEVEDRIKAKLAAYRALGDRNMEWEKITNKVLCTRDKMKVK